MAEKKKLDKKLVIIVAMGAVIVALVVILATCAMFDQNSIEINLTDWQRIVSNSTWTFSKRNISDASLLVPALRDIISLNITSDGSMTIRYETYSLNAGEVDFSDDYSSGTISISQLGDDGYITNNLQLVFSNQEGKKFDQNSYVLTVEVAGVGSLYFFKN